MAVTWRIAVSVVAVTLLVTSCASAFGGRLGAWSAPPAVTYYYAAPMYSMGPYYYNCPPMSAPTPRIIPVPDARPMQTGEPPLQKMTDKGTAEARKPVIVASHAVGGSYLPGSSPLAKDHCRVGFWNLSGRDVTLQVDGKTWTLPKNRAVTLDLERQFSWNLEGRPQRVEQVSQGQAVYEVVIRE
jgi:hypothetical protein